MNRYRFYNMQSKSRFTVILILLFSALFMSSCIKETVADLSQDVGNGWSKDDKVIFEYDIQDSIMPIDFYINIRNTTDYNYSNIYFFIRTIYPNQRYSIDTVECFLANMKGDWLGSGMGKYRDNKIPFKKNMRFPMTGHYRMEFEMAMRDTLLDGIDALGIRIERADEN